MKRIRQILCDEVLSFYYDDEMVQRAEISLLAQAKINLNLKILGRRQDNYHELETVMQSIALHDQIRIVLLPLSKLSKEQHQKIILSCEKTSDIYSENLRKKDRFTDNCHFQANSFWESKSNLMYQAAQLFLTQFQIQANIQIIYRKEIPVAAGLAGGSSDAAAVLKGLFILFNHFFLAQEDKKYFFTSRRNSPIRFEELLAMAELIGADVPFCLYQGTALCKGKGEIVLPLQSFADRPLILYHDTLPVYTAEAFRQIQAKPYQEREDGEEALCKQYNQVLQQDYVEINRLWHNDFSGYLLENYPILQDVISCFRETKAAFIRFSGSGPTLFALYPSYTERDFALQMLSKKHLPGKFTASHTSDLR